MTKMLKALIKKQFLEYFGRMLQRSAARRKGAKASKSNPIVYALLVIYLVVTFGSLFYRISAGLVTPLTAAGLDWLYFAIMGTMGLALSVVGSSLSTHSTLFQAKDNEMLLSMPIPPMYILFSRMLVCFATSALFVMMPFVPAIAAYNIHGHFTPGGLVLQILTLLMMSLLSLALSCVLGWGVAMIMSKIPKAGNKSLITVTFTLIFLGVYYYYYMKLLNNMNTIMEHIADTEVVFRKGLYPMMLVGRGASGDASSLIICLAVTIILLAAVSWLLSRSFISLITTERGTKSRKYIRRQQKESSPERALVKKEWLRYLSSSTYIINCSLSSILCIIGTVAAVIKAESLKNAGALISGFVGNDMIAFIICALVCFIATMNDISAPSISLEGNNLWIIQSLPVDPWIILRAKLIFHVLLSAVPATVLTVALLVILRQNTIYSAVSIVILWLFIALYGALGLIHNLKHPKLDWINEAYAVKQDFGIMLVIMEGWTMGIALMALAGFGTMSGFEAAGAAAAVVLLGGALLLCLKWLRTRGADRLRYLS